MKGCIPEANLEGQGGKQFYQFISATLGIEIFLKKREHQKKVALK